MMYFRSFFKNGFHRFFLCLIMIFIIDTHGSGVVLGSVELSKNDAFTSDRIEKSYTSWEKQNGVSDRQLKYDSKSILGEAFKATHYTDDKKDGERVLYLYKDGEGKIYDIGVVLFDDKSDFSRIEYYSSLIIERIFFVLEAGENGYLNDILSDSDIAVEYPTIGGKPGKVKSFYNLYQKVGGDVKINLRTENNQAQFDISLDRNEDESIRFVIAPTLNSVTNGETSSYRTGILTLMEFIKDEYPKPVKNDSVSYRSFVEKYYTLETDKKKKAFSIALPQISRYDAEYHFIKKGENWVIDQEQETENDELQSEKIRHYWATRLLPGEYQFTDVSFAKDFRVKMAIEEKRLMEYDLSSPFILDVLPIVLGKSLPAYYGISNIKSGSEEILIEGVWKIINPELAIEHVFRIRDRIMKTDGKWVWKDSDIRGLLALRMDNVNSLFSKKGVMMSGKKQSVKIKLNK